MNESLAAMKVALRVLATITEKGHPDPADIEKLHQFVPDSNHMNPDELACEVIQVAIKEGSYRPVDSEGTEGL